MSTERDLLREVSLVIFQGQILTTLVIDEDLESDGGEGKEAATTFTKTSTHRKRPRIERGQSCNLMRANTYYSSR